MNISRERVSPLTIAAADTHLQERSIGAILVDEGKVSPQDAERILVLQKREGLRFGDAAIKLGLVKPEDIQHALSRQFDYPYLMPGDENVSEELVAAFSPFSRDVEALRALRSQLMLRWFGIEAERRALAVVSAGRGEGRSHLAANLAVVFSQLGERTLLIDADLRRPRQHELFRLSNRSGLSAILAGRPEIDGIQRIPSFLDLSVLTAGPVPPNPGELLSRPAFSQLLERLAGQYDAILLDTAAGSGDTDAQTVAVRAGGVIMVVRQHKTRVREAGDLVARLSSASAQIVGTVLTDF